MSHPSLPCSLATAAALMLLLAGCVTPPPAVTSAPGVPRTFAEVQPILEANCVHCHGPSRLPQMPSFADTAALARLKGGWIVPGQPDSSRLFQVVRLSDRDPGAMPPTGHAISQTEVAKLRAWIQAGAPLPEGAPVRLVPRGERPHSW